MDEKAKREEIMKVLGEKVDQSVEDLKQHMVEATMNSTVLAMALLQDLAGIEGAQEFLSKAEPNQLNEVRGMLYRQGYIIRRVTGELQLSSLGEETLDKAMNGRLKPMMKRRNNR